MSKLGFPGDPEMEPGTPAFQADALTSEPPGKPNLDININVNQQQIGTDLL